MPPLTERQQNSLRLHNTHHRLDAVVIIRPCRSRSAAAYSDQTFPWTICRSVRRSVGACVGLSSVLWKNGGSIRMLFGTIGRTGLGMRQIMEFGDRSTGRGTFGGEFGARHCNQWGLTFAATRPSSKITLGKFVNSTFA